MLILVIIIVVLTALCLPWLVYEIVTAPLIEEDGENEYTEYEKRR